MGVLTVGRKLVLQGMRQHRWIHIFLFELLPMPHVVGLPALLILSLHIHPMNIQGHLHVHCLLHLHLILNDRIPLHLLTTLLTTGIGPIFGLSWSDFFETLGVLLLLHFLLLLFVFLQELFFGEFHLWNFRRCYQLLSKSHALGEAAALVQVIGLFLVEIELWPILLLVYLFYFV